MYDRRQWCWLLNDDDFVRVTILRCGWQKHCAGDLTPSPTSIGHQHRLPPTSMSIARFRQLCYKIGLFLLNWYHLTRFTFKANTLRFSNRIDLDKISVFYPDQPVCQIIPRRETSFKVLVVSLSYIVSVVLYLWGIFSDNKIALH